MTDAEFEALKSQARHVAELRGATRYTVLVERPEKKKCQKSQTSTSKTSKNCAP